MPDSRPTICLCVMVKNEALTFPRLAASVRDHIDTWVVCDTGSTDGTPDVVREALDGIPGELRNDLWSNFGVNRTALLNLARGRADYLLLLDADWTLDVEPGALDKLGGHDCYMVPATGGLAMEHKVLVRGDKPWKAVGPVHEFIDCDQPFTTTRLHGVTWTHHGDGGARDGRQAQDETALRDELAKSARATFYLAQTYRESGRHREAADMYMQRVNLGGWDQEICLSLHHAGIIRDDIGLLLRAWATCPDRLEPLYEAAWRMRRDGHHQAVVRLLEDCHRDAAPDGLFVERWVYEWGLHFEYTLALHNTGAHGPARQQYRLLLESNALPDNIRADATANLKLITSDLKAVA